MSQLQRDPRSPLRSTRGRGLSDLVQMLIADTNGAYEYFLDLLRARRSARQVAIQLDRAAELCRRLGNDGDRGIEEVRRRLWDAGYAVVWSGAKRLVRKAERPPAVVDAGKGPATR